MSERPDDAKQAWSRVGERFAALGKRVAEHYQETGGTDQEAAAEAEKALERAAKEVVEVVQRGVDTVGKTFKDQEAGNDLTQALNALGEAITATGREAGDAIRGRKDTPPEPPAPPTDTA
jgi:coenzyme F420-reducing hydrogenase alpha subunit